MTLTVRQLVGLSATALVLLHLAGCQDSPARTVPSLADNPSASESDPAATSASDPDSMASSMESPQNAPPQEASTPVIAQAEPPTAPGKPRDITFDNIKFEMEKEEAFKRTMLTDEIEALHETPIRIRGYILPSFQQSGIKQFVLVRDNMECCFGPGAALYDCIYVEMEPGKTTEFQIRPVTVSGTFRIREWVFEGRHLAIYHLIAESVE